MHPLLALILLPLTDAIPMSVLNFINNYLGKRIALNSLSSGLLNMTLQGAFILATIKDCLTVLLLSLSLRVMGNSTLPLTLINLSRISTKGVATFFNFAKSTYNVMVVSPVNTLQGLRLFTKILFTVTPSMFAIITIGSSWGYDTPSPSSNMKVMD